MKDLRKDPAITFNQKTSRRKTPPSKISTPKKDIFTSQSLNHLKSFIQNRTPGLFDEEIWLPLVNLVALMEATEEKIL